MRRSARFSTSKSELCEVEFIAVEPNCAPLWRIADPPGNGCDIWVLRSSPAKFPTVLPPSRGRAPSWEVWSLRGRREEGALR